MTAYAVAHLRSVTLGPDIAGYLERIDATLAPFHGRFLVHVARLPADPPATHRNSDSTVTHADGVLLANLAGALPSRLPRYR